MKKRFLIILGLIILVLFSTGCAEKKKNTSQNYVEEFTGKCVMYIAKDDGFYYPTIYGDVALSNLPKHIYVDVAGEKFELYVKSVNVSSNGLYILSFKQTHIFNELTAGKHELDLIIDFGNSEIKIENYATFNVDEDYFVLNFASLGDDYNVCAMGKKSEWSIGPIYPIFPI